MAKTASDRRAEIQRRLLGDRLGQHVCHDLPQNPHETIYVLPELNYPEIDKQIAELEAGENLTIFANWVSRRNNQDLATLGKALIAAINKGANINIILLNPNSPATIYRGDDIRNGGNLRSKILESLKLLVELIIQWRIDNPQVTKFPNFKLFLHDTLPTQQIYLFDKKAYVGFYFLGDAAGKHVNLEVSPTMTEERPNTLISAIRSQIRAVLEPGYKLYEVPLHTLTGLTADELRLTDTADRIKYELIEGYLTGDLTVCQNKVLAELLCHLGKSRSLLLQHNNCAAQNVVRDVILGVEPAMRKDRLMEVRAGCAALLLQTFNKNFDLSGSVTADQLKSLQEILDASGYKLSD